MSSNGDVSLNIVILGCGRVGSTLAKRLSQDGHIVTVIDLTSDAFRRLGTKYRGRKLVGTGLDQETLVNAGLKEANVFISVTQGDNTNIMAAQIAKEVFNCPKVMARIYDPIRAQAYREMGINTLCTTTLAAGIFLEAALDTPDSGKLQAQVEAWEKYYLEKVW